MMSVTKIEKLRIGAAIAPSVRRGTSRRVTVVNRDGAAVRQTTVADIQKAVVQRMGLEFSVSDGKRPTEIVCANCRSIVPVGNKGSIPFVCHSGCDCPCGGDVSKKTATRAAKAGRRAVCGSCATKTALQVKKERGERISRYAPYGFRSGDDGMTVVPDEYEQAVISQIDSLSASGVSRRKIAAILEERGIVSRVGKPLGPTQVHNIINRDRQ